MGRPASILKIRAQSIYSIRPLKPSTPERDRVQRTTQDTLHCTTTSPTGPTFSEALPSNYPSGRWWQPRASSNPNTASIQRRRVPIRFARTLPPPYYLCFSAFLVVIPACHVSWELGREASLTPLELAKASKADRIGGRGSDASVAYLMGKFGGWEVRYVEPVDEGIWLVRRCPEAEFQGP